MNLLNQIYYMIFIHPFRFASLNKKTNSKFDPDQFENIKKS